MAYQVFTLMQRPELETQIDQLSRQAWPEFMLHGDMPHWDALFNVFSGYQLLLCDPEDTVVAVGHTIPFIWEGIPQDLPENMAAIMVRGMQAKQAQKEPTALSALAAIVSNDHRRQGLSAAILREMAALAAVHGLSALVAPVRPTLKSRYPLTPMQNYVEWKQADGSPFDPWMRVHWRLGAKQYHVIPQALNVRGSVAEWESWTGIRFPESGEYIVPGALQPVQIDCSLDSGHYADPNVWMVHEAQNLVGQQD